MANVIANQMLGKLLLDRLDFGSKSGHHKEPLLSRRGLVWMQKTNI